MGRASDMRAAGILAIITAAAAVLHSCGKQPLQDTNAPSSVEVSFASAPVTKAAAGAVDESSVLSLDALVFHHDGGALAASGRSVGGPLTLSVPAGALLDWFLVANAPAGIFGSVSCEDGFLSLPLPLEANSAGSLVMMGHGTDTFDADSRVSAELGRYVSKVSFGRFTPEFQDGSRDVTFEGSYLLNVCGAEPFSMIPSVPDVWYNALAPDTGLGAPVRALIYEAAGTPVTSPAPVVGEHVFYCMPNPAQNGVTTADDPVWSARPTRLVLEFLVDGQRRYYPLTLPPMQSGCHYRVNGIVLHSGGSSHPDVPVERDAATMTVTLAPWGENILDVDF